MTKKRLTAYLLLLLTAIIWGIASPVIKYTVAFVPPFTFLFYRFLIASFFFLPLLLIFARRQKETLKSLLPIIPIGFLGVPLCLGLLFVGYQMTTALDGSVISATAPIFICLAGVLFLKEKVTKVELVGLILAIAGSVIMVAQPLLEEEGLKLTNLFGNLLVFTSVLAWSAYAILSKYEFPKHSPIVITSVSFLTGLVVIFPLVLFENRFTLPNYQLLITNYSALWGIFYMAILSSVVAYLTFEQGLKLIEASEATLFAYLQPIFAAPVAVLWLGEKVTLPFLLGALVISSGVLLAEQRKFNPFAKKN